MKWFDDVFLPSLFERCGVGDMWITAKQARICINNMEAKQCRRYKAMWCIYSYMWRGRQVSFMPANHGCGKISFTTNAAETAETAKKVKRRELRQEMHSAIVAIRRGRYAEKFQSIIDLENDITENMRLDVEEGIKTDPSQFEFLAETQIKRKIWEAAKKDPEKCIRWIDTMLKIYG